MDPEMLNYIRFGLIFYILLVCSVCVHEWAHAYVADKLKDPLPRAMRRVTLNPLVHIDFIGTVLLPLIIIFWPMLMGAGARIPLIGWGKPVLISFPNRKTRVRDDLLITAAGPFSNLLICFVCAIVGGLLGKGFPGIVTVLNWAILMNVGLFVFNLIPIPPLDGSHFLKHVVGMKEETYMNCSRWGFLLLLVLMNIPLLRNTLTYVIYTISGKFSQLMITIATSF